MVKFYLTEFTFTRYLSMLTKNIIHKAFIFLLYLVILFLTNVFELNSYAGALFYLILISYALYNVFFDTKNTLYKNDYTVNIINVTLVASAFVVISIISALILTVSHFMIILYIADNCFGEGLNDTYLLTFITYIVFTTSMDVDNTTILSDGNTNDGSSSSNTTGNGAGSNGNNSSGPQPPSNSNHNAQHTSQTHDSQQDSDNAEENVENGVQNNTSSTTYVFHGTPQYTPRMLPFSPHCPHCVSRPQ